MRSCNASVSWRASGGSGTGEWMLLDGQHLVEDAMAAGLALDTVAFGERHWPGRFDTLAARAAAAPRARARHRAGSRRDEPGSAAVGRRRDRAPKTASLDEPFARQPPLILLLAEVQDPGNVGAIIRAAEACGATGVVAGDATADPLGWKALRGSMGSTFRLPVAAGQPLERVARRARAAGFDWSRPLPRAARRCRAATCARPPRSPRQRGPRPARSAGPDGR
jgi:RNA methyltransferase, TrmH family